MDEISQRRAQKLLQSGLEAVGRGELVLARDQFKASADLAASADAFTYWGWMEHHLGNTKLAIELCEQAIDCDPDFGNPYNDIGSYLISEGKIDDAIPWLEKAIAAKRYEPRQFPHINLGRVYFAKEMPLRALQELRKALEFSPNDQSVMQLIEDIQRTLN